MPLQLDPIKIPRSRLIYRIQTVTDILLQLLSQHLGRISLGHLRRPERLRSLYYWLQNLQPLLIRQPRQILPVLVQNIKYKSPQRQRLRQLLYSTLPTPLGRLLKRQILISLHIISNGLAVQDHILDRQRLRCSDKLGKHQAHTLQISRINTHLIIIFVYLHPEAIVLGLHQHRSQLLHHCFRIWQSLR